MEGGLEAVSHQALAERAHVGRATVYRHFPNRQAFLSVLLEIVDLQSVARQIQMQDTPEDTMYMLLRWAADTLGDPLVRSFFIAIVSLSHHDPEAAEIVEHRYDEALEIVDSMVKRFFPGQYPTREDRLDLLAQIIGPVWMTTVVMGQPVSDEFLRTSVKGIVSAMQCANQPT